MTNEQGEDDETMQYEIFIIIAATLAVFVGYLLGVLADKEEICKLVPSLYATADDIKELGRLCGSLPLPLPQPCGKCEVCEPCEARTEIPVFMLRDVEFKYDSGDPKLRNADTAMAGLLQWIGKNRNKCQGGCDTIEIIGHTDGRWKNQEEGCEFDSGILEHRVAGSEGRFSSRVADVDVCSNAALGLLRALVVRQWLLDKRDDAGDAEPRVLDGIESILPLSAGPLISEVGEGEEIARSVSVPPNSNDSTLRRVEIRLTRRGLYKREAGNR